MSNFSVNEPQPYQRAAPILTEFSNYSSARLLTRLGRKNRNNTSVTFCIDASRPRSDSSIMIMMFPLKCMFRFPPHGTFNGIVLSVMVDANLTLEVQQSNLGTSSNVRFPL